MPCPLPLLAAGGLRLALTPLLNHFTQLTGIEVEAQYGPAGLLRERIEVGEPCALFASANREHPNTYLRPVKRPKPDLHLESTGINYASGNWLGAH